MSRYSEPGWYESFRPEKGVSRDEESGKRQSVPGDLLVQADGCRHTTPIIMDSSSFENSTGSDQQQQKVEEVQGKGLEAAGHEEGAQFGRAAALEGVIRVANTRMARHSLSGSFNCWSSVCTRYRCLKFAAMRIHAKCRSGILYHALQGWMDLIHREKQHATGTRLEFSIDAATSPPPQEVLHDGERKQLISELQGMEKMLRDETLQLAEVQAEQGTRIRDMEENLREKDDFIEKLQALDESRKEEAESLRLYTDEGWEIRLHEKQQEIAKLIAVDESRKEEMQGLKASHVQAMENLVQEKELQIAELHAAVQSLQSKQSEQSESVIADFKVAIATRDESIQRMKAQVVDQICSLHSKMTKKDIQVDQLKNRIMTLSGSTTPKTMQKAMSHYQNKGPDAVQQICHDLDEMMKHTLQMASQMGWEILQGNKVSMVSLQKQLDSVMEVILVMKSAVESSASRSSLSADAQEIPRNLHDVVERETAPQTVKAARVSESQQNLDPPILGSKYSISLGPEDVSKYTNVKAAPPQAAALASALSSNDVAPEGPRVRGGSKGWVSTPERWSLAPSAPEELSKKYGLDAKGLGRNPSRISSVDDAKEVLAKTRKTMSVLNGNTTETITPDKRSSLPVHLDSGASVGRQRNRTPQQAAEDARAAIHALMASSQFRAWD